MIILEINGLAVALQFIDQILGNKGWNNLTDLFNLQQVEIIQEAHHAVLMSEGAS